MEKEQSLPSAPIIDEYKLGDILEATQEQLVRLIRDREHLDWRINKLQNDVVHLAALCGVEVEDPMKQLGLTDAIRWTFAKNRNASLSVKEITEALRQSYRNASQYKNLPANVQTIVKRLLKAEEITVDPPHQPSEDARFRWAGNLPPLQSLFDRLQAWEGKTR